MSQGTGPGAGKYPSVEDKRTREEMNHKVRMRQLPVQERTRSFDEINHGYTPEEAMLEARRCLRCKALPCGMACPIHQDIHGYVGAIAEGDFNKALSIVIEKNPMPASMGRVCAHLCQNACKRGKLGDPLQIMHLKRAADDYGKARWTKAGPTGKRVAVIGAGPAGIIVASDLARKGHYVKVFEREKETGGMLRYFIPSFRLPRSSIDKDIQRTRELGVEFEMGVSFGPGGKDIESLLTGGFDAVFIGIGTYKPKMMNVPGEDKPGVMHAIPFFQDLGRSGKHKLGKSVAVIGGGNVAMDAVRVARRLGVDAFLVYRRDREQMPAAEEEVHDCEEEGVQIKVLTSPVEMTGNECVEGMKCIRMRLGDPDESGRARPVAVHGSDFTIVTDSVIEAVSQEPDVSLIDPTHYKLSKWNTFLVDENGMTSTKGVFAGGDCVNGASTIVEAMASARKAADGIHRYLTGM